MTDADVMTPAELRLITEYLGLDRRSTARVLGVQERTLARWLNGDYSIPDGVRVEIENIEAATARAVGEVVDALHDARDAVLVAYATDEDMWAARPEFYPYPARWWRMVLARAAHEVPGVTITY